MSGNVQDRTAYDVLAEIYYLGSPAPILANALCWLLKSRRLEAMGYGDFLAALEAEYEESDLYHLRGMGERRFEMLGKYFLGENGGSKTNNDHADSSHRHRTASRAGRGLADEAG